VAGESDAGARHRSTSPGTSSLSELQIASTPDGATVLLNNRRVGNTPMMLRLPAGTYTFAVEKRGYQRATRTVRVRGGRPANVALRLQRTP
jgi:hypothetical protein